MPERGSQFLMLAAALVIGSCAGGCPVLVKLVEVVQERNHLRHEVASLKAEIEKQP